MQGSHTSSRVRKTERDRVAELANQGSNGFEFQRRTLFAGQLDTKEGANAGARAGIAARNFRRLRPSLPQSQLIFRPIGANGALSATSLIAFAANGTHHHYLRGSHNTPRKEPQQRQN